MVKTTPLKIRNLVLKSRLILAPMAGISHTAFRQLVSQQPGYGLCFSEMQPCAAAVSEQFEKSFYLYFSEKERPLFYQLAGNDPLQMERAMRHLEAFGPDGFDINMGCPVYDVTKTGCGAALMRNPKLAQSILSHLRKTTDLPLTVKIRIGWEEDEAFLQDYVSMLEHCGVDAITLHARTVGEKTKKAARWRFISLVKKTVRIPVIGNGDVASLEDVQRIFSETGCDGVMIGRGAVRKPWIFQLFYKPLDFVDIKAWYLNFIDLLERHFPPERRAGRLKEFTYYFQKNFMFGHSFYIKVQNAKNITEIKQIAKNFFDQLKSEDVSVQAFQ